MFLGILKRGLHLVERFEGSRKVTGDSIGGEDGGVGGKGENGLRTHGAEGVPDGVKEADLAKDWG